jgi:hypothetical protein
VTDRRRLDNADPSCGTTSPGTTTGRRAGRRRPHYDPPAAPGPAPARHPASRVGTDPGRSPSDSSATSDAYRGDRGRSDSDGRQRGSGHRLGHSGLRASSHHSGTSPGRVRRPTEAAVEGTTAGRVGGRRRRLPLDGPRTHPPESRDRDARRDNAAVEADLDVLRYGVADVMYPSAKQPRFRRAQATEP